MTPLVRPCVVLAIAAMPLACSRDEPPHELFPSTLDSSSVDTVPKGELAEGSDVAFGLKLPRDLRVEASFDDAISAVGTVPLEAVTNYVRARVETERVETGPVKTVFAEATLKSDPKRRVQVEIARVASGKVEVTVRERTPRPLSEPGLSEKERWRRAGIGPNGEALREANE